MPIHHTPSITRLIEYNTLSAHLQYKWDIFTRSKIRYYHALLYCPVPMYNFCLTHTDSTLLLFIATHSLLLGRQYQHDVLLYAVQTTMSNSFLNYFGYVYSLAGTFDLRFQSAATINRQIFTVLLHSWAGLIAVNLGIGVPLTQTYHLICDIHHVSFCMQNTMLIVRKSAFIWAIFFILCQAFASSVRAAQSYETTRFYTQVQAQLKHPHQNMY